MTPRRVSVGSGPRENIRRTMTDAMRVRMPEALGTATTIAAEIRMRAQTKPESDWLNPSISIKSLSMTIAYFGLIIPSN